MQIEITSHPADQYQKGTFCHNNRTYKFTALIFEDASQYGINGGRISKLSAKEFITLPEGFSTPKGGNRIYADTWAFVYNRGWDGGEPTGEAGEIARLLVAKLEAIAAELV
ncbi:MAG: hypothetical protein JNM00_09170 [Flavobacteriales bacterium]|nr:hypothetical protein [Flavobacteriales bacterium]